MKLKNKAKWVISLLTAFTIPFSTMGTAVMAEPNEPNNQAVVTEAATDGQLNATAAETGAVCPTYQEAYAKMLALKDKYPEGTHWTNFTPYGRNGNEPTYRWKGGKVKGSDNGVGCAAFVFILSDEAFGALPARAVDQGNFEFDEIKVGDILRTNGNSHFVIILQKSDAGVTVAEGNYNKSVHWGRAISKAEVMTSDFIITRYPTNFVPSDDATADEVFKSGMEGSLSWTLTNGGILTISGQGPIPDYSADESNRPSWYAHNDKINTIALSNGITAIGDCAFYQSQALSVYIPDSVQTIGNSAFRESALINITIPGSVTDIGNDAFHGAENLVSATVTKGVMTIGERAFQSCKSLTYMDFPASITSVGAGAFTGCLEMISVKFMPGGETAAIGDNAFSQCQYLTNIILPQGTNRISNGMFSSCTSLPTLYIPKSVTEIGENPFTSCRYLKTISFGGSEAEWDRMVTPALKYSLMSNGTTVTFNVEFDDPFADLPDDPGDGFDKPDVPPVEPADHQHIWSTDWASDETTHWHQCQTAECYITNDSQKDGYGEHSYSSWVTDVEATASQEGRKHRECTVCQYCETAVIPAESNPGNDPGEPSKPINKPDGSGTVNKPSTKNLATAKRQLKTQLTAKLKAQVESQLKKQLKPKLKKPVSAKRKANLKANLRTKLKKQLKAKVKPQFKQKFGKKLGNQFSKTFDTQFNSQFTKQFNAQFKKQFKQLSAKAKQAKK